MQSGLLALRSACKGYPRDHVIDAVCSGLHDAFPDSGERDALAAIIVAWLMDEGAEDSPPLSVELIAAIQRKLRGRAH